MSRRAKLRGVFIAATLALLVAVAIAVAAFAAGGSDGHEVSSSRRAARPVPDVVGLSEARAVRTLAASGLVANVRFARHAPRTGKVLRSVPAAGRKAPASSVVMLSIAPGPRLPTPGPAHEQELRALSRLIEGNRKAFVGLYRDEAGVPHVVFGPGVDRAPWTSRLRAAAGGIRFVTNTCSRDRASLQGIQRRIASKDWTRDKSLPFAVDVDPSTCTVRVVSDLLSPRDIEALVDRFGTAISIETTKGSHPVLLKRGAAR